MASFQPKFGYAAEEFQRLESRFAAAAAGDMIPVDYSPTLDPGSQIISVVF